MNKRRVTYFALGAFVFVASCSREAAEPDVIDWGEGYIYFRSSMSDLLTSRAQDMTLDRLESFQVTCFNTADTYRNPSGQIPPYFENATYIKSAASASGMTYVSAPNEEPYGWPSDYALLKFFAFSPSLNVMAADNPLPEGAGEDSYFQLINRTDRNEQSFNVEYSLSNMRINPDIARQFDFVTAQAAGERWKDFTAGVELAFSHQLCQVELRAWGDGSKYDFEIAGLRIGNPVVEGSFVFADDFAPDNSWGWVIEGEGIKDKVEYLYGNFSGSAPGLQPGTGDRIFRINSTEHNTAESAASIMGQGGSAMVIPTVNSRWEGRSDPNINSIPYATDRMYFSILTRVTDVSTGELLYPYPDDKKGMTVVTFAVDEAGNVLTRLYAGEGMGEYFSDASHQNPYAFARGVEPKDFGWAAVPVDADWSKGKRYIYTLNYSEGIGLHDPDDPDPGMPIGAKSPISWEVSVGSWDYAEPDDNYTPDLNVP